MSIIAVEFCEDFSMISQTSKSKIIFVACVCIILCLQTGCNQAQQNTSPIDSLKLVDDFPLYTMHYTGEYTWSSATDLANPVNEKSILNPGQADLSQISWGCSLFAALGDAQNFLYGRNFDWKPSPALLLFVKPAQGYASVSIVDIAYLGFEGEKAKNLLELSAEEQQPLLDAPSLPFDGMNEKGLVIGMASVPGGNMPDDPQKDSIDSLLVIREMLDHAATVDEAVAIIGKYDIDMGSVPLHYLIADRSGKAVLVEYYQGEMIVQENEEPWHVATNFIVASTGDLPQGRCTRYDKINSIMQENQGKLSTSQSISLLQEVSSGDPNYGTQWSVVYNITSGGISVVLGRNYEKIYTFNIKDE